jgi:hypothetical protein
MALRNTTFPNPCLPAIKDLLTRVGDLEDFRAAACDAAQKYEIWASGRLVDLQRWEMEALDVLVSARFLCCGFVG